MESIRLDVASTQHVTSDTPTLYLDFEVIRGTFDRFRHAFPGARIDYAMKANANPMVLETLAACGSGFEIASLAELERALATGVSGDHIICSNPIKNPTFLKRMAAVGVYAMVADSSDELIKIAQFAPGSRVYVRLSVDNSGAVLPLAGKFGVDGDVALTLLDEARDLGLQTIGLSFHVGSQCLQVSAWVNAIREAGVVWRRAVERGHSFYFLDIGGGFPAGHYHTADVPTIEQVGLEVMRAIADNIPAAPDFVLSLEPGRGMVGEAGRLVGTVVGRARRGDQTWLYLDVGVFNGLMETYEGFPPVVRLLADDATDRSTMTYTLAGPSCDSCDVIARDLLLPEMRIGDQLLFLDTGAYTNEYAAAFNGFPIPEVVPLHRDLPVTLPA